MPEPALQALARWEDAGAGWRLVHFAPSGEAVVELLTCYGEAVDVLSSDDPELLDYLRRRPASSCDPPEDASGAVRSFASVTMQMDARPERGSAGYARPVPDVDRLLTRIGLDAPPAADLAGLRAVHRAYLTAMPYDTLAIHLGEYAPLDLDALLARATDGGRGGYCFELNGLLGWLLEALGFGVSRREACVGARGSDDPTNHLALVVEVPGVEGRWLADAGLGEGWLEPLALVPGTQAGPGRLGWTLERGAADWWITHHPWGSFPGFTMRDPTVGLDAFAEHHERLSTHPDSSFMRALVVQAVDDHAITTLRARTLTRRGPDADERRVIADAGDFAATLRRAFGIDPTALGEERLARLWSAADGQHAAWEKSAG